MQAVDPVGALRRFEPIVDRLELVVTTEDPAETLAALLALPVVARVLSHAETHATVFARDTVIALHAARPAQRGGALVHRTGNAAHLRQLRRHAGARGIPFDLAAAPPAAATEQAVYEALGLAFIPPELRQGQGEIEEAAAGPLPAFLEVSDIRGDLHVHSDWSDGRDAIEVMVRAAKDLGYEYVAITDHSPHAGTARTVNAERLLAQAEEIDQLREAVPGIAVLKGVEVDILPSGQLDLPDRTLERLDVVLASLHDPARHSRQQLTARYVAAMRHPLVHIVTHPTNRIVGHHDGYDLDLDALFAAAAETQTVLEVDGAPIHLDLDGALARRAVAAGAALSVDSDCHRAAALRRQMQFGVGTARRGRVAPTHVVNTRPLGELHKLLQRKRM